MCGLTTTLACTCTLFVNIITSSLHHQNMVMEIIEVYTDMVNCSMFPEAYEQLTRTRKEKLKEWIPFEDGLAESSGAWLPQIVREIRYTTTCTCIFTP